MFRLIIENNFEKNEEFLLSRPWTNIDPLVIDVANAQFSDNTSISNNEVFEQLNGLR